MRDGWKMPWSSSGIQPWRYVLWKYFHTDCAVVVSLLFRGATLLSSNRDSPPMGNLGTNHSPINRWKLHVRFPVFVLNPWKVSTMESNCSRLTEPGRSVFCRRGENITTLVKIPGEIVETCKLRVNSRLKKIRYPSIWSHLDQLGGSKLGGGLCLTLRKLDERYSSPEFEPWLTPHPENVARNVREERWRFKFHFGNCFGRSGKKKNLESSGG